jgi:uncharacterized Ntn-hydrolase superfamily protein
MKAPQLLLGLVFTSIAQFIFGQNLPSLLNDKNINSTFSIVAYNENTQEWGIAVATNNICVGNSTIYIEPGVGAFSVIAETEPDYAINGLQQLRQGKSIEEAINFTKVKDKESHYRQVGGLDQHGNAFAFTGEALSFWNGTASHLIGDQFLVMGNQLADSVLMNMANTYKNASGTFAERLLKSLKAGQMAGGQVSGKQSAALVVKGSNNEWYNQIDLRVDNAAQPFEELQTLLDYYYGRIRLNQSIYAYKAGNSERAHQKLKEAESLLKGWNGMYGKIAYANTILGDEDKAVTWIQKGLNENPSWTVNLPAFYYLRENKALSPLIKPETFSIKDWENATQMLIRLGRHQEALKLCQKVLTQEKQSSYLYYLLAQCQLKLGEKESAIQSLNSALELNQNNVEAKILLNEIQ